MKGGNNKNKGERFMNTNVFLRIWDCSKRLSVFSSAVIAYAIVLTIKFMAIEKIAITASTYGIFVASVILDVQPMLILNAVQRIIFHDMVINALAIIIFLELMGTLADNLDANCQCDKTFLEAVRDDFEKERRMFAEKGICIFGVPIVNLGTRRNNILFFCICLFKSRTLFSFLKTATHYCSNWLLQHIAQSSHWTKSEKDLLQMLLEDIWEALVNTTCGMAVNPPWKAALTIALNENELKESAEPKATADKKASKRKRSKKTRRNRRKGVFFQKGNK